MPISRFANRTVRRTPTRSRSWWTPVIVLALLVVSGVASWLGLQFQVQNQLRNTLQAGLDGLFEHSLLQGEIIKAEFIAEKGIHLYDVSFDLQVPESKANWHEAGPGTDAEESPINIEIYEAFLELPVSLPELLTCCQIPSSIQIRRARIRLQQSEQGDWHIGRLIEEISRLPTPSKERIPIDFRDCTIELVSDNPQLPSLTLSDVAISVRQIEMAGQPLIQVQGEFNGREVTGTQFTLLLDERQQLWNADVSIPQLRISPNILTLMPGSLRQQLSNWPQIAGTISGTGTAAGDFAFRRPTQFACSGTLKGFSCEDPKLPLPIRNTSLNYRLTNDTIEVRQARGSLGEGGFELDWNQQGIGTPRAWSMSGRLDRFDFNHFERFLPWLPESLSALNEKYNPGGIVDLKFAIGEGSQGKIRNLHAQLINASFNLQAFPYLVENCTGEATWIDDRCVLNLRSSKGMQTIQVDATIDRPGPDSTFQVDIAVPHGIPFDEKLQAAMNATPRLKQILNDFNPTGNFSLLGRLEKNQPASRIIHAYDVRLQRCTVKHNFFDYPIYDVNGLVQVRDQTYAFVDLTGNNSGAAITANGGYHPTEGLDVKFLCRSIPLDNQLKQALPPDLRKIWTGFRPSGTLDIARVRLIKKTTEPKVAVTLEASMNKPQAGNEPSAVSIKPVWFPYEIQQLSGNVKIGDGKIELTDIQGVHGRTWMACFGEGEYGDEAWWLTFKNLLVGSLKVDEDLFAALPKSLAPPIRKLAYEGALNVHGEVTLAGTNLGEATPERQIFETTFDSSPPHGSVVGSTSLAWNLRFDMNQVKMKVGLPLENVFGSVQLTGEYDGKRVDCLGELAIDSLTIYGMQVTNLKGPISLDGERTTAGVYTSAKRTDSQQGFSPVASLAESPRSLTGELYDGLLKLDAQISSDPTGEFYLQTTLADACLNQLCKDNAAKFSDLKGRSFAALRLTGNSLGSHSYRGDGRVQLRKAEIFQLPVMLAVIKSMRVGTKSQTAFDESNIDFRISGEEIEFPRIEMLGNPVSLLGNGRANLNREIDLNFYSVMGKNRFDIPILSELYRASSQQVMWIQVNGTIDSPQTHRNVLPQINDSLKQLFQPVESANAARQQ